MSSVSDVCGVDVQSLYLEDPGNNQDISGYVLCSEMGNTCVKNGCSCRSSESATVNGATKYFGVCVVLKSGADCVTSGDAYVTCATGSSSSSAEAQNESNVAATSTTESANTKTTTESNAVLTPSTIKSDSGSVDAVSVSSNAVSAHSMSMTVMVVIIVVAVVFVALVSYVVRTYCTRRSAAQSKIASRRNRNTPNLRAASPTNGSGRSSVTPSFPAFDRRARAMQSPSAGGRGGGRGNADMPLGRNTPRGREPNSGRGRRNPDVNLGREPTSGRGRRNPDVDFGRVREPISGRGRREPEIEFGREPKSGRGLKPTDLEFGPSAAVPRGGFGDAGMKREPASGRGRRSPDMPMLREPISGRGRRSPDMPRGKYQVEPPNRPDKTPPRDLRAKQHASPRQPAARAPPNAAPQPQGGTVFTGRNTYERVAQFAQLAAFEAPPPPPPRPQRPIQPVPVMDPVPKHARGIAPNAKPARAPAPKRPAFFIPEAPPSMDYASLSPKTARSMAPSVASSATTVVAQGRNRPTPLQQYAVHTAAPPRFQSNSLDESGFESKFESKFDASGHYDDSFVSEVSSMAWSGASGLSDDSYYHAASSNTARIPVIDAPRDDDEGSEADNYSDWGNSTQASDAFRSTAASDASFFSVNSDFADTRTTAFKEREF